MLGRQEIFNKGVSRMRLTPVLVARSQLLTAIELFFADRDPVSVQALAGNARELLEDLCRQAGVQPMTELLLRDRPGKPLKDIYAAMNLYRNCFKHLGKTEMERKEDQRTLDQFNDSKNEYLLYVCVEDYFRLRKALPMPMQVFQAWFCALHVDLLAFQEKAETYLNAFPGILQMTRTQQKRGATAALAVVSENATLLAHQDTEPMIIDQ
jgi:hypothetical protein